MRFYLLYGNSLRPWWNVPQVRIRRKYKSHSDLYSFVEQSAMACFRLCVRSHFFTQSRVGRRGLLRDPDRSRCRFLVEWRARSSFSSGRTEFADFAARRRFSKEKFLAPFPRKPLWSSTLRDEANPRIIEALAGPAVLLCRRRAASARRPFSS